MVGAAEGARSLAVATDADVAAVRAAARGDARVREADILAGHGDRSAVPGARGVDRAGDADLALAAADEFDGSAISAAGGRADHAGGVDRVVEGRGRAAGAQQHAPAAGVDHAAVDDPRAARRVAVDGDADHAVAGEVDRGARAGRQRHGAAPGEDHAVVLDVGADEGREAGLADRYVALVDDACAGLRAAADAQAAVALEAVGVDTLRRGDEAADIDLGAFGEKHAGVVLDDDGAGCANGAFDDAAASGGDAVEGGGIAAGLIEIDAGAASDVEAAPVDHRAFGGLADRGARAALGDLGGAFDDLAAFGGLRGAGLGHEREHRDAEQGERAGRDGGGSEGPGKRERSHARILRIHINL